MMNFLSRSNNTFEGIHSGEQTNLILRRHWFVLVARSAAVALAVSVAVTALTGWGIMLGFHGYAALVALVFSLFLMLMWLMLFYFLMLYALDVWVVTNERIIDSRQLGFFNRTISEMSLSKVQDVSVEIHGVIETFLHFGNIKIQSAGTEEHFLFEQIPQPEVVKELILEQAHRYHPVS